MLRIATFGRLELARDGYVPLYPAAGKPAALLAYLLLEGRAVAREAVAGLLWPGMDIVAARVNLRQALFSLRRQIDALHAQGMILATATHLGIDPSFPLQSDWAQLRGQAAAPDTRFDDAALRALDVVAERARGTLLDGFEFVAGAEFDAWLRVQRAAAQRALQSVLVRLAAARERRGGFAAARDAAARALELDPGDEAAHLRWVQLQLRAGQVVADAAIRNAHACDSASAAAGTSAPQRLPLTVIAARLPPHADGDAPEAALAERRTLAAGLRRIVVDHGGYWMQTHGAEFFAYFGYPCPSERSAVQAVFAACTLRQRCAQLAQAVRRDVVISDPLGAAPDELGVLSASAAALLRSAQAGDIVLGAGVAERAQGRWALQRADGSDDASPHYRLGAQRPQPAAPRTPFVGRDSERAWLLKAWSDARRGRSRVVLLHGDAGLGKSRLVDAFVEGLEPPPPCVRVAFDGSAPARDALALLGALAGVQRSDGDARREQAIMRYFGPEHSVQRQRLSALLLREHGAAQHRAGISPLAQRRDLLELAQRLLRGRCGHGALLLVVDDVHQASAATQALLQELLTEAGLPVLALLTARSPWPAAWPALHAFELPPLRDSEIAQLLATLGADSHDAARRAWLVERSAGNPLFAEELVALRGPAQASARIADLLGTRLAQLGDACATAQHAAVIGQHFEPALLGRISPHALGVVERHVAQLRAAGIVHPAADGRLAFRHGLLRDTAYAMLGAAERKALHRRVALALHDAGDLAHAPMRAEHWELALDARRAAAAWLDAGADALQRHVYTAAAACYARGLAALAPLAADAQRDALELRD